MKWRLHESSALAGCVRGRRKGKYKKNKRRFTQRSAAAEAAARLSFHMEIDFKIYSHASPVGAIMGSHILLT